MLCQSAEHSNQPDCVAHRQLHAVLHETECLQAQLSLHDVLSMQYVLATWCAVTAYTGASGAL
jgi:hypothetical protein